MAVKEEAQLTRRGSRLPDLQPGKYSDGHPLDEVQYLECKIILKPDPLQIGRQFLSGVRQARAAHGPSRCQKGIEFIKDPSIGGEARRLREVVFLDTPAFGLYNNAFILRRRIAYARIAVGEPEIVFKFRHPDLQKAAELDVRPNVPGRYRIKFKAELLPLRERLGGFRTLYSHNCEFGLSELHGETRTAMSILTRAFPALSV